MTANDKAVNPIVAKAAAGIRKRRTRTAPVPAKLYDPTPGQMTLFDPADQQENQP
ncbi:hypothetical protein [Nocardia xishanensis]|uniref:Uncharacterized protein n=1 Tax=Nocardia xishanensis TaxID=238964 RepID=A0ABW7XAM9_9NOCA